MAAHQGTNVAHAITVNGKESSAAVSGDTPLLWVLRDDPGLSGTHYGCGMGLDTAPAPPIWLASQCDPVSSRSRL